MYFELMLGEAACEPAQLIGPRPGNCAGGWRVTAGAPVPGIVLLHRWERLDDRETAVATGTPAWGTREVAIYGASPAWKAARRDQPLPTEAVYELRIQRVLNGFAADAARVMGESTLPLLQAMGAHVIGVFDLVLGAYRPRMATFLAWPNFAAQQDAWARLDVEPRFWRRRDEDRTRLRRRLFGDEQTFLLAALPGYEPQPNFGLPT